MTPEMRTVCLAPVRTEKGRVQVKLTRRRFVMVPLKFSLPGIALGFGVRSWTEAQAPKPVVKVEDAAHSPAPSGRLRVAINLGNSVLAQRTPTGTLTGVSVILAQILAKRLHVPLDLIPYTAAGMVFDALDKGAWDVAFLAIEPERATKVDFSPPYVFIDGTYLVRKDSPFQKAVDLDRPGLRVAVARGAAYDLYLSRTLKSAELLRAPNGVAAMQMFVDEHLDAAAGVRQALADYARDKPELKVLGDSFSQIDQAIGIPKGRSAGAAYVRAFVEEMKASGEVRRALDETGQASAGVSPPAN
jgi:polar amino acid transport system substrate-binding protein